MYVGLVLLADDATERLVQRLAEAVYRHLSTARAAADARATRLPAHVSLKQPFACDDLAPVLCWCDDLATRTAPVAIELAAITYGEFANYGILGLEVIETPILRALHNQLNAELARVVADPAAPFDGDAYRFHLTVAMEPIAAGNPCRAFYEALADPRLAQRFTAERLALAVCQQPTPAPGTFCLQRVVALTGASR